MSSFGACPRLVSNITNGGLTLNSSEIIAEKQQWKTDIEYFYRKMQERDAGVSLVGDSLSATMWMQILCLEEFVEQKEKGPWFGENLMKYPFVGKLQPNYTTVSMHDHDYTNFAPNSTLWYTHLKLGKFTKKYVVINTGAWFGHVRHVHDNRNVNYIENYRAHFSEDSNLIQLVKSLVLDNVTVIWRDTSPAGVCGLTDQYVDHPLFRGYNSIARKALAREGVLILEDIWNATLPYWDQHLGGDKLDGDHLHYCLFQIKSAQNVWIKKLMSLILKS
jgi:hypothetical protein